MHDIPPVSVPNTAAPGIGTLDVNADWFTPLF